jgi:hypothetical protein
MDRLEVRLQARELVGQAINVLAARGIALPDALKRRDPREPRRREKEAAEDRLTRWVLRYWGKQRRHVREVLEAQAAMKQGATLSNPLGDVDEEDLVSLSMILRDGASGGVDLFDASTNLGMDFTSSKTRAYDWALEHAGEITRLMDKTSLEAVARAVSQFVSTGGMTIADVMELLPFGEERALRVAITEITGAYAQGQLLAGQDLRAEFPDVKVVVYWFTNNDERVCEICSELDGESVDLGNLFPSSIIGGVEKPPAHLNCRCWCETTTEI